MHFALAASIIATVLLYYPVRAYLAFRKNLLAARATGIPYICMPAFPHALAWQLPAPLVLGFFNLFPPKWQPSWLPYIDPEYAWHTSRKPFKDLGSDTVLFVCPDALFLNVSDPAVVSQITTRRNDFPKPIELYLLIKIYGENVVTSEGATWRRHRKTTTPPFGEKNNRLVWKETLFQTQQMVTHWSEAGHSRAGSNGKKDDKSWGALVNEVSHDCMRLSLYVISRAGFDVRCEWPGMKKSKESEGIINATEILEGCTMSYMESLETLLHNMFPLFVFPPHLLGYAPFKIMRLAGKAYYDWGRYMNDVYTRRKDAIMGKEGAENDSMDLMGSMIRGSGIVPNTLNYGKEDIGLSKQEIMGNSFILFLAGHETAANTIHFALLMLAARPSFQRRVQAELDQILGDRPVASWDYDSDLLKLFSGLVGAVMNEVLRLIPPVTYIPKSTAPGVPQPLNVGGKQVIIPGGTQIGLQAVATHRNPKYWPFKSSLLSDVDDNENELDTFKPERWFADKPGPHTSFDQTRSSLCVEASPNDSSTIGQMLNSTDTSPDTASSMFRPSKGAYIPFSEGARACLGRRFAQVEILASLAVILKSHNVDLSLDEWASEEELENMTDADRTKVWKQARKEMERKLKEEAQSIITIQLRGKPVKLKFVERGSEKFKFEHDEEDVVIAGSR